MGNDFEHNYTIGCLPSLPCRHCVKPANSAAGGKDSFVIGSRKNVSKLEKCITLLQTLVQRELKSTAEWAWLPSLGSCWTCSQFSILYWSFFAVHVEGLTF